MLGLPGVPSHAVPAGSIGLLANRHRAATWWRRAVAVALRGVTCQRQGTRNPSQLSFDALGGLGQGRRAEMDRGTRNGNRMGVFRWRPRLLPPLGPVGH